MSSHTVNGGSSLPPLSSFVEDDIEEETPPPTLQNHPHVSPQNGANVRNGAGTPLNSPWPKIVPQFQSSLSPNGFAHPRWNGASETPIPSVISAVSPQRQMGQMTASQKVMTTLASPNIHPTLSVSNVHFSQERPVVSTIPKETHTPLRRQSLTSQFQEIIRLQQQQQQQPTPKPVPFFVQQQQQQVPIQQHQPQQMFNAPSIAFDAIDQAAIAEIEAREKRRFSASSALNTPVKPITLVPVKVTSASPVIQTPPVGKKRPHPSTIGAMPSEKKEQQMKTEDEGDVVLEFNSEAMKTWDYPIDFPKREYQFRIVNEALFQNTLVCLPTGLGKTFIAAVIMLNFYRWFPKSKVIFIAHTRALVCQQIEACHTMAGIPKEDMCELTGQVNPTVRVESWLSKRVFFLTPQVLTNDIARHICPAASIRCIIFDEAHKAQGNSPYVQVMQSVSKYTHRFRSIGLTASPGRTLKAIQTVIDNLHISRIEVRTESDPDVKPYLHNKTSDVVVVPLGPAVQSIKEQFLPFLRYHINKLVTMKFFYDRGAEGVSPFQLLASREKMRASQGQYDPNNVAAAESSFAAAIVLSKAYYQLVTQGIAPFERDVKRITEEGMRPTAPRYKREMVLSEEWKVFMAFVDKSFAETTKDAGLGHPKMMKLKEVISDHFARHSGTSTRVIVFATFRETVKEITHMLSFARGVHPVAFVGQSTGRSGSGLKQKDQLDTLNKFRGGTFNVLVATVIGEEGLDIGEVDLIVCYDCNSSPTRLIQRFGRTGRKRDGRVVVLVAEGEEQKMHEKSMAQSRLIQRSLVSNPKLTLYQFSQQVIPVSQHPVPREIRLGSGVKTMVEDQDVTSEDGSDDSRDFVAHSAAVPSLDDIEAMIDQDLIDSMANEHELIVAPASTSPAMIKSKLLPPKEESEELPKDDSPKQNPPESPKDSSKELPKDFKPQEKQQIEQPHSQSSDIVYPEPPPLEDSFCDIVFPDIEPEHKKSKEKKHKDKEKKKKKKKEKNKKDKDSVVKPESSSSLGKTKKSSKIVFPSAFSSGVPTASDKKEDEAHTVLPHSSSFYLDLLKKLENGKTSSNVQPKSAAESVPMPLPQVPVAAAAAVVPGPIPAASSSSSVPSEPAKKKKVLRKCDDDSSDDDSSSSSLTASSMSSHVKKSVVRRTKKQLLAFQDSQADVSDDDGRHPVSDDEDEGGSSQDYYSPDFVTDEVEYEKPSSASNRSSQERSPVNERAMYAKSLSPGRSSLFSQPGFKSTRNKLVFTHEPKSPALRLLFQSEELLSQKLKNEPVQPAHKASDTIMIDDDDDDTSIEGDKNHHVDSHGDSDDSDVMIISEASLEEAKKKQQKHQ